MVYPLSQEPIHIPLFTLTYTIAIAATLAEGELSNIVMDNANYISRQLQSQDKAHRTLQWNNKDQSCVSGKMPFIQAISKGL